jgi:hypothetical protein
VAIDTLQRVRARSDARRNAYEVDVEDLGRLQGLFRDRSTGLLVVHHSKKDAGDDFLASVSGTYGITGSADTTLVIQRKRLETFGKLVVTGRDVEEVEEAVQFNGMTWTQAPRSLAEATFEQAEVYKVIEAEGPLFPKAIAERIGSTRQAVQHLVNKMVDRGSVVRSGGGYAVAALDIDEQGEQAHDDEMASSAVSAVSTDEASRARTRVPAVSAVSKNSVDGVRDSGASGDTRPRADPRATRRAREAGPELRVIDGDATASVTCHFYADHKSEHHRGPDDAYHCRICSPCDVDSGCSLCLEEGAPA